MKIADMRLFRWGRFLASALALWACGGPSDDGDGSQAATGGAPSAPPPAAPAQLQPAPPSIPPEAVAAVADALSMVTDQLRTACGGAFDVCSMTSGCDEILACAARNGCTGSACYCMDSSCQTAGPCRSVIDGAPGARLPDADDPSLGPASDAAVAVGDCLGGLGGGSFPRTETPTASDGGAPSEAPDAG